MKPNPTSALLIIGDEILSGRTQDKNIQYIAQNLGKIGVSLSEVRVVPDVKDEIIQALNHLRAKYNYLFTTGGIGPTHDDITAESVAEAFKTELYRDEKAYLLLENYYGRENLNEGRIKMSYVPRGSVLIDNPVTIAPGFKMENVFVLAGVPKIMQAMFEYALPHLEHGVEVRSVTLLVHVAESILAAAMTKLQEKFKDDVTIGSYPFMHGDQYQFKGVHVVFRSRSLEIAEQALKELEDEARTLNLKFERI